MSACGVCVSTSYGNECTGYRAHIGRAGQQWECSECGKTIKKGDRYEFASWFFADGSGHGCCKTCLVCAEIAEAFQCGGRYHASSFWESMESAYPKLNTSCFDRLKTPEAKAHLRHRWMAWKGLPA